MTQIEVWEIAASSLNDEEKIFYWADKLVAVCEHINSDTRLGTVHNLFSIMEGVCDRYNQARNYAEKAKENE